MIAARQIFLGRGGGAKLPYDARVQYIESNGTQYIDTEVIPKSTIGARMLLLVKGIQSDKIILMAGGDSVGWRWGFSSTGNNIQISGANATGVSWENYAFVYDTAHEVIYNWNESLAAVVDGETVRTGLPSGSTERTETIWLNASANGSPANPWRVNSMKIYSLQMCDGDVLIRDYIPVRIGSNGFLYDRISGRIFGAGDFEVGADVNEVSPTSDTYVQDGLVLMFDAIENSGRGLHSSVSQEWIDIRQKAAFVPQIGSCSFSDNLATLTGCILRGVNGYFTPALNSAKFTVQYVIPSATDERGYVFWRYGSTSINPSIEIMRNNPSITYCDHHETFAYTIAKDDKVFISFIIDGSSWSVINTVGEATRTASFTQKTFTSSNQLALLGSAQSPAYYFTGTACAIRIYNRALTAEEIAANYAVDKQRFNLP